jgi:type IV secretory pathway VirB2 component (pilin)
MKSHNVAPVVIASLVLALASAPAFAQYGGSVPVLGNFILQLVGILTGPLARSIGIIVVIGSGIAVWLGHMTGSLLFRIVIGATFVFGGAAIIDLF